MANADLNDDTLRRLTELASAHGMTVDAYVESLAPVQRDKTAISSDEFDAELRELSFQGPSLPGDFSRADIYLDHD